MTLPLRRAASTLALALALTAGLGTSNATHAVGETRLTLSSTNHYTVDEAARTVHSHLELTASNNNPDPPGGYYYFNSVGLILPAAASNLSAVANGNPLRIETGAGPTPQYQSVTISLPWDLRQGQSVTISLDHDLIGAEPRSANFTRVGHGYASFEVFALGDPGQASVRVDHGIGMTVDGGALNLKESPHGPWAETSTNTIDGGIAGVVSLRLPSAFTSETLKVGPAVFHIEPWPEDQPWKTRVVTGVQQGVPALSTILGTPWPTTGTTLREDAVVTVNGYDGWYRPNSRELVLGEQAEPNVIYHELSHAWLNHATFSDRWVIEGLAQNVADRAGGATRTTVPEVVTVDPTSADAVRLQAWTDPQQAYAGPADVYAYPAARAAMAEILADQSPEQVATILHDAIAGEVPFRANGQVDPAAHPVSTKAFLDLVEFAQPRPKAVAAYRTWVLGPADVDKLARREEAFTAYRAVDALDGNWTPGAANPAMRDWDYPRAIEALATLQPSARAAGEIQRSATAAGVAVPPRVREAYTADGASDPALLLGAAAALKDVAAATTATIGPVARLGAALVGVRTHREAAVAALTAGNVTTAKAEAGTARQRAGYAVPALAAAVALALILLVGLGRMVRRAERGRPKSGGSEDAQHPGVAQGVGLDPLEVEELRDPLVVGPEQLGIDLGVHGPPLDRGEPVPSEEVGLEGQAEQSPDAEAAAALEQRAEDR